MSNATKKLQERAARRINRTRVRLAGSAQRPRFAVVRSAKHLSAQLIDDAAGMTLVAAHDREVAAGTRMERATALGTLVAKKAIEKNITAVVFDRRGRQYHGLVKAVADAARKSGLHF